MQTDVAYAKQLDAQDELAHFRERFIIDDTDVIYLDGNSLGRMPKATAEKLHTSIDDGWGKRLIRGWNDGWIDLPQTIGAKLAQLLGAQPDEIIIADSTSVNLFKLAVAALQSQPNRHKIITDDLNFPSDLYVLQGISTSMNQSYQIEVIKSTDGIHGNISALADAVDHDTALVSLTHTTFKSGYTYPMADVTAIAKEAGAMILWDLSHSAGSVPIDLNGSQADLAVGCTYKYLNGGPGSPAFLYINFELQKKLTNPILGWMGQKNSFDFGLNYQPADGIQHFLTGTPPILSTSAIEEGVDLLLEAGMTQLRAKSVQQSEFLIDLWEAELASHGFTLNSPRNPALRGSHISLGHPDGWRIAQALIQDMNVLPDFRKPDNIRFGIAPLYTTFQEIQTAIMRLCTVIEDELYLKYSPILSGVT